MTSLTGNLHDNTDTGLSLPPADTGPFGPNVQTGPDRPGPWGGEGLHGNIRPWAPDQRDRLQTCGPVAPPAFPLAGEEVLEARQQLLALAERLDDLAHRYDLLEADEVDEAAAIRAADRAAVAAGLPLKTAKRRDFPAERDVLRREWIILAGGMRPARTAYAAAEAAGLIGQARRLAEAIAPALVRAREERTLEAVGALLAAKQTAEDAYRAVQLQRGLRLAYPTESVVVATRDGLAAVARLLAEDASPELTGEWTLTQAHDDEWPLARRAMIAKHGGENDVRSLAEVEMAEKGEVTRWTEAWWPRWGAGHGFGRTWH